MKTWSAKLVLATEITRPDDYVQLAGCYPAPDFVVSRHTDGRVASVFSDDVWDFTAYHAENTRSVLYFNIWKKETLTPLQQDVVLEVKWIIFLLIFMKKGTPLSYGTLVNHFKPLKVIMRYCADNNHHCSAILKSASGLRMLFGTNANRSKLATLTRLLRFLRATGPEIVGFEVAENHVTDGLLTLFRDYTETLRQHAPVPTRIYSEIISTLSTIMDEFDDVSEKLLEVVTFYIEHPGSVRKIPGVIRAKGLAGYFNQRGTGLHVQGLSYLISETLVAASLQIQLFTGMRSAEVRSLPYHCLSIITRHGREHFVVCGRTTKLNRGRKKEARWITSSRGKQAIQIAQRIARAMYSGMPDDNSYLFVNSLLGDNTGNGLQPLHLPLRNFHILKQRLAVPIDEADLTELENIDPHRAWRAEKEYQPGSPWPLRRHQFRRSLALYAQRSGIVTLPSLKRQLQHITEEMSRYYAKGSAFATDFIGGQENHIGKEWQDTQVISQYLGYAAAVIFSDDALFGGHGNWITRHQKNEGNIIQHDRVVTIERFKLGLMAFRETAIGGCIATTQCEKGLLDVFSVSCIKSGCANLVGSYRKLERVIAMQYRRVEQLRELAPHSPEFRSELSDLEYLLSVQKNHHS